MSKDPVEIETEDAVLPIPKNAVKLTISATVFQDDELQEVESYWDLSDIKDAVKLFEQTVEGEYPRYALTEKGREYLAQIKTEEREN